MEAITLPIYSSEGKETDTIKLDMAVFDGVVNKAAIHQAIVAYRANNRCGLAATKTRGEVSGGGKKPWRQKGTGRARVGSTRSPLWRHGGVVFGPHPRDFSYNLPQKIRTLALKSILNAKVKENNLIILESLSIEKAKTKDAAKIFDNLKLLTKRHKSKHRILLLLDKHDLNLQRALNNLSFLSVDLAKNTNSYETLIHKKIILTKDGLTELCARLKK